MDRRTFGKLIGMGAAGSMAGLGPLPEASTLPNQTEGAPVKWPTQTYRRYLADMHVPDSYPVLMSRFDPEDYVRTIADAGFQSILHDAQSEAGLCLYPTKVGQMHGALKGRDFFGEVVAQCRRRGIHVLAYFSLMTDNWAYQNHPDWRFLFEDGYDRTLEAPRLGDRYPQTIPAGEVCPNSPYRDYVHACLKEIVTNYDIDGMFLDQIFWPGVCYCPHCTARFWREYKTEPPRIVDWDDPTWRQYQKMRQQSLLDFALANYRTIKEARPITVCHQYSTLISSWDWGVPLELNQASDYAGGDFYGGPAQFSLVCKAFDSLTKTHPYELHTGAPTDGLFRLSLKSKDELRLDSLVPTLHSAPHLLIDGILPDGTLYKPFYEVFAKTNALVAQYEPFLGGDLLADVAIYFDKESLYNPAEKGVHVSELKAVDQVPHRDAWLGIASILPRAHIPFGVVTNVTLEQLSKYRAVILPNVLELTAEQAVRFRTFVEQGGVLYASGPSSLDRFDPRGPRFLLEDVLGVRYKGTLGTQLTYFTPRDAKVKEAVWPQLHIKFAGSMVKVEALPGAEVLATVTLPFVPVESERVIGSNFADIESDQPALTPGSDPALVQHSFGKGSTVWLAAPLESVSKAQFFGSPSGARTPEINARLVLSVLRRVLSGPYYFEVDTHPTVEMTLFHQAEKKRLLAGLLNMQQEFPAIPVGATVRVQVPSGRRATRVVSVPQGKEIPFEKAEVYTQFRIQPFEALAMALIEYE
jgi:hypothetical protein